MGEIVTRKRLARLWGVSGSAIDNLVQAGKLTKVGHGKFDLAEASKARGALRPTASRTDTIIREAREAEASQPVANLQPSASEQQKPEKTAPKPRVSDMTGAIARARVRREEIGAKAIELKFKREAGLLVDAATVKTAAANASRLIVGRLRSFPSRLGPQLASENSAAKCAAVIEAEVRLLITEFQELMAKL